jgi:H+/Cl- antiporter ClcA
MVLRKARGILRHKSLTPQQKAKQSKYESLDFDQYKGSTGSRLLRISAARHYVATIHFASWIVCLFIGATTGVIGFFIHTSLTILQTRRKAIVIHLMGPDQDQFLVPLLAHIAICAALVLVATCIVAFVEPVAAGSGIPEVKCFLNGVKVAHLVRIKTLVSKVIGIIFSVGGGLPVGKEGPMIHAGAAVGGGISQGRGVTAQMAMGVNDVSFSGRLFSFFKDFRNDRHKRDFVAIGSASGVAAAFGAPIGGVLFALEEGVSHMNQLLVWQAFFAAMVATFTLNVLASGTYADGGWGLLKYPALVSFGSFDNQSGLGFASHHDYNLYDIGFFAVIGVAGGLFGALFNEANLKLSTWRMKHVPVTSPFKRALEAVVVAVTVQAVLFLLAYYYKDCRCARSSTAMQDSLERFYCPKTCEVDGNIETTTTYNAMGTLVFNPLEEAMRHLFHQACQ